MVYDKTNIYTKYHIFYEFRIIDNCIVVFIKRHIQLFVTENEIRDG